jgi:putative N6-adenine-specific DNA methylase
MEPDNFDIIVKTFYGLEEILASELKELDAKNIRLGNRAVTVRGNKELLYRINYSLRTAVCVLKPLLTFNARNEDELYKKTLAIEWDRIFGLQQTFAIESVVYSSIFKHSQYAALKVKDAIVDQYRQKTNHRPDVDTENPDILINLHIAEEKVTLSLNSSGEPLFKRGYRIAGQQAPLNEVLAAGLIKLSGWNAHTNFIDPMCGSGTLLIEAALIANNIPPGIFRKKFSFENWPDFDHKLFHSLINVYKNEKPKTFEHKIIGADISPGAIKIARKNIKNAFLHNKIELCISSFEDLNPNIHLGIMITNPPYGERIKQNNIQMFYKNFGDILKKKFAGYEVWILSSNKDAMKHIGLHPSKKIKLMNGALECMYNKYEIYSGSKQQKII